MPDPRILIDPEYEALLKQHGLLDLDALFSRPDLTPVKALLTERQTFRVTLDGRTFYIKRYPQLPKPGLLASLLHGRQYSPAAREWHALRRLIQLGVPTITPAACLEDGTRAALVTIGLDAPNTLEELALGALKGDTPRRRELARQIGSLLRRMHDGGINHRDFYLVHLRVGADDTVYVTDLNRADIRRNVGERWRVKDLAALLHSAAMVGRTDRARCARAYFGGRLRDHRALIAAVQRKAARITAHTRKKVAKGEANYHEAG